MFAEPAASWTVWVHSCCSYCSSELSEQHLQQSNCALAEMILDMPVEQPCEELCFHHHLTSWHQHHVEDCRNSWDFQYVLYFSSYRLAFKSSNLQKVCNGCVAHVASSVQGSGPTSLGCCVGISTCAEVRTVSKLLPCTGLHARSDSPYLLQAAVSQHLRTPPETRSEVGCNRCRLS